MAGRSVAGRFVGGCFVGVPDEEVASIDCVVYQE